MKSPPNKGAPKTATPKHAGGSKHPATAGGSGAGKHKPSKAHKASAPPAKKAPQNKPLHPGKTKPPPPKNKPAPKPKKKAPAKKRGLTPGDINLCSAEALAASLRLSGRRCAADDVQALYWHTTACPDTGASILATLNAASVHGLAGHYPRWFGQVPLETRGPVILGTELPGPHSLLAIADGRWWTWGQLHNPAEWPDATIEEAWAVLW